MHDRESSFGPKLTMPMNFYCQILSLTPISKTDSKISFLFVLSPFVKTSFYYVIKCHNYYPPTLHLMTISHGCQIVYREPLNAKQSCPNKKIGLTYVKMHGFPGNR